ncbi:MAG TPA: GatB/YqeY domain-containing protein [Devosiaceae bacterium]
MRDEINAALSAAMKARQTRRMTTLRLINAAIKDRDIDARGEGREPVSDDDILQILQKMVKQREESIAVYDGAGRSDLAAQEREEVEIIREFLPKPLGEEEVKAAIAEVISETGAEGLRDMGKVVNALKERYPGRIDVSKCARRVKEALGG